MKFHRAQLVVIRRIIAVLYIAVIVLVILVVGWDIQKITDTLQAYPTWGPVLYVMSHVVSTVIAPLASLPLVPFATVAWGILATSLLNIIGWWIGSLIAFEISRTLGRPFISVFMPLDRANAWIRQFSDKTHFVSIILTRLMLPVEIPSYILGLFPAISFRVYAIATLIGIIPFAFIWSILGKAFLEQTWVLFSITALGGIILFSLSWLVWRYH
ncbi:MAG: VTT domain-containing protein [Candidatus Paceibacterota bacterium]